MKINTLSQSTQLHEIPSFAKICVGLGKWKMKHWWNGNIYFCSLVCEITYLFFHSLTQFWGDNKGAPSSAVSFWNISPACSTTTLLRLFWAVSYLYWTPADFFAMWRHAKNQHCISRSIFSIVDVKRSAPKSVFTHRTNYPPKHPHVLQFQIYHYLYCHMYFPRTPLCLRIPWRWHFI